MRITLTDVLTCPRCGPEFGLIVLADRLEDRLVREGRLGCPNCRESYPIRNGVADLRGAVLIEDADGTPDRDARGDPAERAFRAAALLGVGHGGGSVLIVGGDRGLVSAIGDLLPNAYVVGAGRSPVGSGGAGWLLHGQRLPLRSGTLRGVALLSGADPGMIGEAARVLSSGSRVLLDPAPEGTAQVVAGEGLEVILDQDGVVVASAR